MRQDSANTGSDVHKTLVLPHPTSTTSSSSSRLRYSACGVLSDVVIVHGRAAGRPGVQPMRRGMWPNVKTRKTEMSVAFLAAALACLCHACPGPGVVPPAVKAAEVASTRALPPTVEELRNATYAGLG